jgi:hypothetical protein
MSTSSGIYCPTKVDLKKKVFGEEFTPDELHFLRCRDAKFGFVIDTRVNDAFRNGFVFENPKHEKEAQKYIKQIRMACKWAILHGFALVDYLDTETTELKSALPPGATALGIQAMTVYISGLGGISGWDKDPKTGMPTVFHYKTQGDSSIPIDISRVTIITWGDEQPGWQGYSGAGRLFDPAVGMRMWLGAALRRQRDYPSTRFIVYPDTEVTIDASAHATFKTEVSKMFTDIEVVAAPYKIGVAPVAGPIAGEEEALVIDQANKDSAVSGAVAVTDMTGSQAGAKLSTDSDTATYAMTAKDIQMELLVFIQEIFKRLGMPILGFKTASELPAETKIDKFIALCGAYNNAAQELKEGIAKKLEGFYNSEFGMEITITVAEPEPTMDESEEGSTVETQPKKEGVMKRVSNWIKTKQKKQ